MNGITPGICFPTGNRILSFKGVHQQNKNREIDLMKRQLKLSIVFLCRECVQGRMVLSNKFQPPPAYFQGYNHNFCLKISFSFHHDPPNEQSTLMIANAFKALELNRD